MLKDYLLVCSNLTASNRSGETTYILDGELVKPKYSTWTINPQVIPTKSSYIRNRGMMRSVYYADYTVVKDRQTICSQSIDKLTHEFIYGTNTCRYYSPVFDYTKSNDNVLLVHAVDGISHESFTKPILNSMIEEYDPSNTLVWSWNPLDHIEELEITEEEMEALQDMMIPPFSATSIDWIHINSACCLGENKLYDAGDKRFNPENIIVSSRNLSRVFIVDKSTGDIVYLIKPEDYKLAHQHYAHMIPKGLKGEGNILILDNYSGEEHEPKVVEIDPKKNKAVATLINEGIGSSIQGSVQKLPDGNYLVADTDTSEVHLLDESGTIIDTMELKFSPYRINAYPKDWAQYVI